MEEDLKVEVKIGPHTLFFRIGDKIPIKPDFKNGETGIDNGASYAGEEIKITGVFANDPIHFNAKGWSWHIGRSVDFSKLRKKYKI